MSQRIKTILCDVIDYTYKSDINDVTLSKYKSFWLTYNNKISNSDGRYSWKDHKVIINNLYRDDTALLFDSVVLLAHHVDFVNRGVTNNEWQYLAEVERLLRSAISMGLLSFVKIYDNCNPSDNLRKILFKLEQEGIKEEKYKSDSIVYRVVDCFSIKDKLRANGYKWLSNEKCWEKEVEQDKAVSETEWLSTIIDIKNVYTYTAEQLAITAFMWVLVYECFEQKDMLKERGYTYDGKQKAWKKKFDVGDVDFEIVTLKKQGLRTIKTSKA